MESKKHADKKVVHKRKRIKVSYTNVDGLISKKLEIKEYIEGNKPGVICLAETKLNSEEGSKALGLENYTVYIKDRVGKEGGGVMLLVEEKLKSRRKVLPGNRPEVIDIEMEDGEGKKLHVTVFYFPPQTKAWTDEEYERLMDDSLEAIKCLLQEKGRLILVGDFNYKEVEWETMDAGPNKETWGARLMDLTMRHMITQHVSKPTRFRGSDETSRLDLIFTNDPNEIEMVS